MSSGACGPGARHGRLGETRRDTDAQGSRDELQQGPAADLVEAVEPARDHSRQGDLAGGRQCPDHLGQKRRIPFGRQGGPHQRHRLAEVPDIVVAHLEQHRVRALGRQRVDHGGLGVGEAQRIGQRREGEAPLGVRRACEKGRHQPDLAVAAGLEGQSIEQLREVLHAASGISSSVSSP